MLNDTHQEAWSAYYRGTAAGQRLSEREMAIAGLAAAMALDCHPCTRHYLETCAEQELDQAAVQDVLAKVMAVAAGQKFVQFETYQSDSP